MRLEQVGEELEGASSDFRGEGSSDLPGFGSKDLASSRGMVQCRAPWAARGSGLLYLTAALLCVVGIQGQGLHIADWAKHRTEAERAAVHTPVSNFREFIGLSDDQLYAIYENGTSTIPGFERKNEYQFCLGEPLINAWTQGGYPTGTWPQGIEHPLNNFFSRFWFGKVVLTDETNRTRMWNLVYSNHTVELINNATIMFPSYTRDGKPSVVLDYGRSEAFIFRQFRDEMREVGPGVYLGRVWVVNPVEAARMVPTNPWEELAQQITQRLLNDTLQTALNVPGFQGPGSQGPVDGKAGTTREYVRGEPYPLIYFAMQCIGPKVPALKYGYPAQILQFATQLLRLNPVGYRLPELDHYVNDEGAVDNGVLFFYAPEDLPELRTKGFKLSEIGAAGTLPPLPKMAVEPTLFTDPRDVVDGTAPVNPFSPTAGTEGKVLKTATGAPQLDLAPLRVPLLG